MTVVLWHIELSHYSEKVRWALDYTDIPHERRVPIPGLHGIRAAVLTRGAQRRLPVIDLDGAAGDGLLARSDDDVLQLERAGQLHRIAGIQRRLGPVLLERGDDVR